MRRNHQRFLAAGGTLAVVGQGNPAQTAAFVAKLKLPYPVLADPERVAYSAYGLIEGGLGALLSPAAGRAYLRSFLSGAGGGPTVGHPRQLPGAFVIDRAGIVRFAQPGRHAGDTPTTDELLVAVRNAPSE